MKSEDFKELQEFCDQKGYQLLNESLEDNTKFFVVSKKIEKVTVEWKDTSRNYISFSYNNSGTNLVHRGPELAEVLEKYLNK